MSKFKLKKSDRKNVFTQFAILVAIFVVILGISKLGILDKVANFLYNHRTVSYLTLVPLLCVIMLNILYASSYYQITTLICNHTISFFACIFPILNEKELFSLYRDNDLYDNSIFSIFIVGILGLLVFILGLIWLALKYGFLILFEPHLTWFTACIIFLFLSTCLRSIMVGKILKSFESEVHLRFMSRFYLIPTIILLSVLAYYVVLIPFFVIVLKQSSVAFINYRVMNFTVISASAFLPILDLLNTNKVKRSIRKKQILSQNSVKEIEG